MILAWYHLHHLVLCTCWKTGLTNDNPLLLLSYWPYRIRPRNYPRSLSRQDWTKQSELEEIFVKISTASSEKDWLWKWFKKCTKLSEDWRTTTFLLKSHVAGDSDSVEELLQQCQMEWHSRGTETWLPCAEIPTADNGCLSHTADSTLLYET